MAWFKSMPRNHRNGYVSPLIEEDKKLPNICRECGQHVFRTKECKNNCNNPSCGYRHEGQFFGCPDPDRKCTICWNNTLFKTGICSNNKAHNIDKCTFLHKGEMQGCPVCRIHQAEPVASIPSTLVSRIEDKKKHITSINNDIASKWLLSAVEFKLPVVKELIDKIELLGVEGIEIVKYYLANMNKRNLYRYTIYNVIDSSLKLFNNYNPRAFLKLLLDRDEKQPHENVWVSKIKEVSSNLGDYGPALVSDYLNTGFAIGISSGKKFPIYAVIDSVLEEMCLQFGTE